MLKTVTRALLVGSTVAMIASCADEKQYQFGLRGKWQLESRRLPDGNVLEPPAVGGHYEWYPTGKTMAHVTVSISLGPDQIQVSGYTYSFQSEAIEPQAFTRLEYLGVGGGYGTSRQTSDQSTDTPATGEMVVNGNRVTLEYANGTVQVYEDVSAAATENVVFNVSFEDGTTDTWRRFADQPGVLPK